MFLASALIMGAPQFAALALAYLVYLTFARLVRYAVVEPEALSLRLAAEHVVPENFTVPGLSLGGLGALVMFGLALLGPLDDVGPLVLLGLGMPGLLLFETTRSALVIGGRGRLAVRMDAAWLVMSALLAGVGVILFASSSDLGLAMVLCWLVPPQILAAAWLVHRLTTAGLPASQVRPSKFYLLDYCLDGGGLLVANTLFIAVVGVGPSAEFEGARLLFSPLSLLFTTVGAALISRTAVQAWAALRISLAVLWGGTFLAGIVLLCARPLMERLVPAESNLNPPMLVFAAAWAYMLAMASSLALITWRRIGATRSVIVMATVGRVVATVGLILAAGVIGVAGDTATWVWAVGLVVGNLVLLAGSPWPTRDEQ
jgi:hypothetical protein